MAGPPLCPLPRQQHQIEVRVPRSTTTNNVKTAIRTIAADISLRTARP
jgi:hypothetical protein